MIDSIADYIQRVDKFSDLKASEMIDHFVYYLQIHKAQVSVFPKQIAECFDCLHIPRYSNVSSYLSANCKKVRGQQKFIKNKDGGYKLTRKTLDQLEKSASIDSPVIVTNVSLRELADKIQNPSEKVYLEEAILTFEAGAYRASILMVWLLAVDHLYEYILSGRVQIFINALRKANLNKSIHSKDDFGELKESQFIEACKSAGIISNDVRKILDTKLGIRNSFAHPSTITLPRSKALEFIDDLIENVLLKY